MSEKGARPAKIESVEGFITYRVNLTTASIYLLGLLAKFASLV